MNAGAVLSGEREGDRGEGLPWTNLSGLLRKIKGVRLPDFFTIGNIRVGEMFRIRDDIEFTAGERKTIDKIFARLQEFDDDLFDNMVREAGSDEKWDYIGKRESYEFLTEKEEGIIAKIKKLREVDVLNLSPKEKVEYVKKILSLGAEITRKVNSNNYAFVPDKVIVLYFSTHLLPLFEVIDELFSKIDERFMPHGRDVPSFEERMIRLYRGREGDEDDPWKKEGKMKTRYIIEKMLDNFGKDGVVATATANDEMTTSLPDERIEAVGYSEEKRNTINFAVHIYNNLLPVLDSIPHMKGSLGTLYSIFSDKEEIYKYETILEIREVVQKLLEDIMRMTLGNPQFEEDINWRGYLDNINNLAQQNPSKGWRKELERIDRFIKLKNETRLSVFNTKYLLQVIGTYCSKEPYKAVRTNLQLDSYYELGNLLEDVKSVREISDSVINYFLELKKLEISFPAASANLEIVLQDQIKRATNSDQN